MVTRRMRRDAALRSFVIKRKNGIRRAACLERPDFLEVFAFEEQRCPAGVIQPGVRQDGCSMNVGANPLVRCADTIEIE